MLVVECLALGMEQFKVKIVELLKEVLAADGINIRGVYERSDANAVSYTHLDVYKRQQQDYEVVWKLARKYVTII